MPDPDPAETLAALDFPTRCAEGCDAPATHDLRLAKPCGCVDLLLLCDDCLTEILIGAPNLVVWVCGKCRRTSAYQLVQHMTVTPIVGA